MMSALVRMGSWGPMLGAWILTLALLPTATVVRADSTENGGDAKDEVLSVVHRFLDALGRRDIAVTRELLLDQGFFFRVRGEGDETELRTSSHAQFFERLAEGEGTFVERIWEPTVLVQGSIATVWAPYDFHLDGERIHCGVDAFHLVRTKGGWRIATTLYTVEREGCTDSPLGPVAPPE